MKRHGWKMSVAAVMATLLAACSVPRQASSSLPTSSAQVLAEGYRLSSEVSGAQGRVARIHAGPDGRRFLVLGVREEGGFRETGWGFVLPCERCGFDLPPSENLEVRWAGEELHIRDRSRSAEAGEETDALLVLRYAAQQWRLARVEQYSKFHKKGTAEKAIIDYDLGYSYDATGRLSDGQLLADSVQESQTRAQQLPIQELNLY